MEINATPFNDQSVNTTGCCPRFNEAGWDEQRLHFNDKTFVRASTRSVAHVPLNMGKVFARVLGHIDAAHAVDPEHRLVLSRDLSGVTGEHLFAVTAAVPDEEMMTLTGDFLTKVFSGPFSDVPDWYEQMQTFAREEGHTPKTVWFYFTTCPNCAKAYGKNPVVGLVELGQAV